MGLRVFCQFDSHIFAKALNLFTQIFLLNLQTFFFEVQVQAQPTDGAIGFYKDEGRTVVKVACNKEKKRKEKKGNIHFRLSSRTLHQLSLTALLSWDKVANHEELSGLAHYSGMLTNSQWIPGQVCPSKGLGAAHIATFIQDFTQLLSKFIHCSVHEYYYVYSKLF